ncbi:Hypothetical protein D9617_7g030840 [Elsinoe fawcettii]|nr:Hypothetical protein D9617_7g030840 [Elsinoe fawcettii]
MSTKRALSITRPLSSRAVTLFLTPRLHNIHQSSALLTALKKTYGEVEHFRNYRYNQHDVKPNLCAVIFREARDAQRLIRARNLRFSVVIGEGVHGEGVSSWELEERDTRDEEELDEGLEWEEEGEVENEREERRKVRPEFGSELQVKEGERWGQGEDGWGAIGSEGREGKRDMDAEIEEAKRMFESGRPEEELDGAQTAWGEQAQQQQDTSATSIGTAQENSAREYASKETQPRLERRDSGLGDTAATIEKDESTNLDKSAQSPSEERVPHLTQDMLPVSPDIATSTDRAASRDRPATRSAFLQRDDAAFDATDSQAASQALFGGRKRPLVRAQDERHTSQNPRSSQPKGRSPRSQPPTEQYNDPLLSSLGDMTGSSKPLGRRKPSPTVSDPPSAPATSSAFTSILDSFYGPSQSDRGKPFPWTPSRSRSQRRQRFSTTSSPQSNWPPQSPLMPKPGTRLTFSITAYASKMNFEEQIAHHPYNSFFKPWTNSIAAKDLEKRVPIKAFADFTGRKEGKPARVVKWQAERARVRKTLREIWEEGRQMREREVREREREEKERR